jgi:hypothetical protein
MRIFLLFITLLCFAPPAGKRNGKIVELGVNNVQVSTKDVEYSISKDHIYYKNPKVGDSVWVTPGPAVPDIYRDSRLIKEVDPAQ